ncbi:MAG TPA: RluA family pseudouridine synthase [Candidatus Polarisedimenticolia bacterium]|nr:RluA family pseudouridine synthase [Candidatus Polarisedimenticolia bacterium]
MKLIVEGAGNPRLDRYLMEHLSGESRTSIQRLILEGHVHLEDKSLKPSTRVRSGDRLLVEIPDPVPSPLSPEAIPLDILHRDPSFLVVLKPSGMVVHPGAGRKTGTLVHALLALEGSWSSLGGEERPGIVHRLDRDTSGLLVVARNDEAHRNLSAQFASRRVTKIYQALVWGTPAPARGRIDAPLGRHPVVRTRMSVRKTGGRVAISEYESIERLGPFTLLQVRILTGRTHQIRVHLKHAGHPVVGDLEYGGARFSSLRREPERKAAEAFGRLALHAQHLEFLHPVTGEPMRFEAPLPPDFALLLARLRKLS